MLITATSRTTEGNVYILENDDDLMIGVGVVLRSTWTDPVSRTGADAVISWTGTHKITVHGTIYGADEAINLVGCVTPQKVGIGKTGQLFGGGDGVVEDADGVILDGVGSTLTNAGTITAYGSALSLIVADGGTTMISNSGTLYGRVCGVWHKWGLGTLTFTNNGTVQSPGYAFLGGDSTDNVINHGSMIGTVALGNGNDFYDGQFGTVTGQILGGDGDDTFRPGHGAETINGGNGTDLLDFRYGFGVGIALDGSFANTCDAAGDVYAGIETIYGSRIGADHLRGDAGANTLMGFGGHDTLDGAGGNDTLTGGAGVDTLTGGLGDDVFVFVLQTDGGDVITDFSSNAAGNNDSIRVDAAGFGGGLVAGVLAAGQFQSRADNLAQDADDRFIFRTTDKTLWFDADGNGAGAAILLADLQDGATMTAADILIV